MPNGGLYGDFQNQEHSKLVPKFQNIANDKESILTKKQQPSMTLELTKAYDFTPSFSPSTSRNIRQIYKVNLILDLFSYNFRSLNTPSSMLSSKYQSWTPTTPTPCSALRPSFSLHNLASKTFTEVLVPSIKPPANHQVTPPQSASPKSPRFSPSAVEKNVKKTPMKSQPSKKDKLVLMHPISSKGHPHKNGESYQSPQITKSQAVKHNSLRPYTSLSSLSEISENLTFLECKKEISV